MTKANDGGRRTLRDEAVEGVAEEDEATGPLKTRAARLSRSAIEDHTRNGFSLDNRRELLRDYSLSTTHSNTGLTNGLQGLLQRLLASHADPYVATSEGNFSCDDFKICTLPQ